MKITKIEGIHQDRAARFASREIGFVSVHRVVHQPVLTSYITALWPGPSQRLPFISITGVPPTSASNKEFPSRSR